ncbi:cytidine deaminase [Variovorax boronicumulans]|uniref:anti-phage dCTP deaminase n=1 Tax=Variovorax boronicumulans TaxID=436515 RepID=UPI002784CF9D|nr:anti-phage dCTP deaminase [Variovorax boronicumulans]MDQ0073306.1 cytidine deaminase [Variovorax boronicumulans]
MSSPPKSRPKKRTSKNTELGAASNPNGLSFDIEPDGRGIELVFGLVGPTGVDLNKTFESLRAQLKTVNYQAILVKLSDLIDPYLHGKSSEATNEYERIKSLMENGTRIRELTEQRDILGRLGIAKIRATRVEKNQDPNKPIPRTAYVVSSFKRPEEVDLFRQVYGKAFCLISVYAPRESRIKDLARRLRSSVASSARGAEEMAVQLVARDFEEEERNLGQRVGKTFPLADYFVTAEPKSRLDEHLLRLVRLSFGYPYISPTRDEQGMFFAQAAALRSMDLSRQVGAAITDADGAVLSTGCNEVPKFGGGLYWGEDSNLARDFELGNDSNVKIKSEIIEDALSKLRKNGWLKSSLNGSTPKELANISLHDKDNPFLKGSLLFDVIEFGRAVHAEAASITEAARRGVKTEGAKLFCTTFPCHICARHITASGIMEVVFIEPYEKSRTAELYSDSISVEPQEPSNKRANFRAFVGVAPRAYMDYFRMARSRKDAKGDVFDVDAISDSPRIQRIVLTYLLIEDIIVRESKPLRQME